MADRIFGKFGESTPEETIPWFFGIILAAATRREPGAYCFVLDKTPGTTAIAALLIALIRANDEFPNLVDHYARTALRRGQRVKVKPSNHVYVYDGLYEGIDDGFGARFWLKVLGQGKRRTYPCAEVLRLEPTERKSPKGRIEGNLPEFERSPLDRLLNLNTCGNNSVFRNSVLIYMTQAGFAEVADTITLRSGHADESERLSTFFPWGAITHDGELRSNDAYQVAGEPLVAVSRTPEDLALASLSAKVSEKIVLVDGARGLATAPQSLDDMAERQRVVILASPEETEALDLLAEHGCSIWHMTPSEITIGEVSRHGRTRESLVGATIRRAETRRLSKITTVDCRDDSLEAVAAHLESAAAMVENDQETPEVEELVARLYGILFEFSECCFGVGEDTRRRLREVRELIVRNQMWLDPRVTHEFVEVIDRLESMSATGFGEEKADALLNVITESDGGWAVTTRSPQDADRLRVGLRELGTEVPVLPITAINSDYEYEGVIVPAWPNRQRFARLENVAVAEDIRVLTYPFERKWVLRHQAHKRASARSNRLDVEDRASILGIDARLLSTVEADDPQPAPSSSDIPPDLPILRITDRIAKRRAQRPVTAVTGPDAREAWFVQLFGGCHALLTEWCALPLLNELVEHREDARIREAKVSELSTGDFVLFRGAGNKDFTRLLAEESLGASEYEQANRRSERWKISLRRLGGDAATIEWNLRQSGLGRSRATIRGWLRNPNLIGPQRDGDLEIIARASGDSELLRVQDDVIEAIHTIRSAHRTAGRDLTTLILRQISGGIDSICEEPKQLDFEYGEAWIVQVASIDAKPATYPSNQVNRLLWADDQWF